MRMKNKNVVLKKTALTVIVTALTLLCLALFGTRNYYAGSAVILAEALALFFMSFEKKKKKTRELTALAVMVAISVASRAAFFMLPQVKPMCAIVIISAVAFGSEAGFLTGATSIFLSNFIFGQGPWTPFQMVGMGLCGLLCGLILKKEKRRKSRIFMSLIGGGACFVIYGFFADINSALMMWSGNSVNTLLAVFVSGIPFNLIHALTTGVILFTAGKPAVEMMDRIKEKYGIFIKE